MNILILSYIRIFCLIVLCSSQQCIYGEGALPCFGTVVQSEKQTKRKDSEVHRTSESKRQ